HVVVVADAPGEGAGALEERAQRGLALNERHVAQIPTVEVEEVEREVADRLDARADRVLQRAEVAPSLGVEDHDLAVQPGRAHRQLAERARQRSEAVAPAVALSREEPGAPVLEAREHA